MWLSIFSINFIFQRNHTLWFIEENKNYAIHTESQLRGSSRIHLFIWIFNAQNIENEAAYNDFIKKQNAHLLGHLNNPGVF